MKTMIEYLNQGYRLQRKIDNCDDKIERYNHILHSINSPVLTDMPKNSSPIKDKMADTIAKKVDIENERDLYKEKQDIFNCEIVMIINKISEPILRQVLTGRYVDYKTWYAIAEDINKSERHTLRLHGQALNELKNFFKKN